MRAKLKSGFLPEKHPKEERKGRKQQTLPQMAHRLTAIFFRWREK